MKPQISFSDPFRNKALFRILSWTFVSIAAPFVCMIIYFLTYDLPRELCCEYIILYLMLASIVYHATLLVRFHQGHDIKIALKLKRQAELKEEKLQWKTD